MDSGKCAILKWKDCSDNKSAVKRALSFLMLFGALIGLLGQEAAYAAGPVLAPASIIKMSADTGQMSADCMEMMQKAPQPSPKPCKGMTPDCIASMGCVIPLVVTPESALMDKMLHARLDHFSAPPSALTGRVLVPEPEPPTRLI